MKVRLSPEEVAMAASVAIHRGIDAIVHNRKNQHGFIGNGWTENIEGYGAELAVSKALNLYYSAGAGKGFKGADVSEKIQVRWASQDNYRLIVRAPDQTDHVYVLVTGEAPEYNIKGFIPGQYAKQDKYYSNPGNGRPDAWWVPQSDLKSIEHIQEYLKKHD
jgi:hypothetical protein